MVSNPNISKTTKKSTSAPPLALVAALAACLILPGVLALSLWPSQPQTSVSKDQSSKSDGTAEPIGAYASPLTATDLRTVDRVPRIYLKQLPQDLHLVNDVKKRKRIFVSTLLPLILKVNEGFLADRERLRSLQARALNGRALKNRDIAWLRKLERQMRIKAPIDRPRDADHFDRLLLRVDIIPPSLALTQAAVESGWGTSRFARQGNALFGEWVWGEDADGILPERRAVGKNHKIKRFDRLIDSVRSYMVNLNRNKAYQMFRQERAALRLQKAAITGVGLAPTLTAYSERGQPYVDDLVQIMQYNRFGLFDELSLEYAEGR